MSYPRDIGDMAPVEIWEELQRRLDGRVVMHSRYDMYQLSRTNRARCKRWHSDAQEWTASDWANALAGEVGELCNIVKKVRRHETGAVGSYNTPPMDELRTMIADEIADVYLYLDLVAAHFRLNLWECIVPKFNRVSEAQGFPERLGEDFPVDAE